MVLDQNWLAQLCRAPSSQSWQMLVSRVMDLMSCPLDMKNPAADIVKRDRETGTLDQFLASSAWDLWLSFEQHVPQTAAHLLHWWKEPWTAKAILILDGLSLRELPLLLQQAQQRGYTLHQKHALASELPGETSMFARALGYTNRSQLQNNGAADKGTLQPARTESVDLPWQDCRQLILQAPGNRNWVFWHHWPDARLHAQAAGQGLEQLAKECADQLNGDDFWSFVDTLATGRRLIITSDHGYAATGYFHDAEGDLGTHLKKLFASGRNTTNNMDAGPFVPPVALPVANQYGLHLLALGRRKWRSQGGYPTLTHGGLSLLEVLSPVIEISK